MIFSIPRKLKITFLILPLVYGGIFPLHSFAAEKLSIELVDWKSDQEVNVTSGDATITSTFVISSTLEITALELNLKSLKTSQTTELADVILIKKIGNLKSYEAKAVIKANQAPRKWIWSFKALKLSDGSLSNLQITDTKWKPYVSVINSVFTQAISSCEKEIDLWNGWIDKFEVTEKNYPEFDGFSLIKIKAPFPFEKLDMSKCESGLNSSEILPNLGNFNFQVEYDAMIVPAMSAHNSAILKAKNSAQKQKSLLCVKGKATIKIGGNNPRCPKGYKIKK
jgi:hypothetical protein